MVKRTMWVVLLLVFAVCGTGCAQALDEKINDVRAAKYIADQAFVQLARDTIKVAREGWAKKHALQEQIIRQDWATWLRTNGASVDAEGNWSGTIDVALMLKSLEVRHAADVALEESKASVEKLFGDAERAIDLYAETNAEHYATEQEAIAAKRKAVVAIQAALEGIGALGGGFAAGFMAG